MVFTPACLVNLFPVPVRGPSRRLSAIPSSRPRKRSWPGSRRPYLWKCRGGIYSRPFPGGHKALPYIFMRPPEADKPLAYLCASGAFICGGDKIFLSW